MNNNNFIFKNLLSIDILRFLAAFSVYYFHQHIGLLIAKTTNIPAFNITDGLGAYYAVPLFFLISGFCIHFSTLKSSFTLKSIDLKKYYLKRFWRIYPPYLISLFLSFAIFAIIYPPNVFSIEDFFSHIFVLQGFSKAYFNSINLVLWTITIEVCFYIVYPLFYFLIKKYSINKALYFSGIISILSILFFLLKYKNLSLPQLYFFTNIWFGWCFGAWICDKFVYNREFLMSKEWKYISVLLFSLFILLHLFKWHNDILIKYNINIIVWSPLLVWLILNENTFIKFKNWLLIPLSIGASSYSLYLLHQPFIELKNYIIHYYFKSSPNYIFPLMLVGVFLIPVICYINYKIFELPFMVYKKNEK